MRVALLPPLVWMYWAHHKTPVSPADPGAKFPSLAPCPMLFLVLLWGPPCPSQAWL